MKCKGATSENNIPILGFKGHECLSYSWWSLLLSKELSICLVFLNCLHFAIFSYSYQWSDLQILSSLLQKKTSKHHLLQKWKKAAINWQVYGRFWYRLNLSGVSSVKRSKLLHFNTHLFPYPKKKTNEGLWNSLQKQGRVLPWVFVVITHV